MTFDPQRPRYTLNFANKEYELLGTMGMIEEIEYALKESIVKIYEGCLTISARDMVKLLTAILNSSGHKIDAEFIRETLWNKVGLASSEWVMLTINLHYFLRICVVKPEERAATAKAVGEFLSQVETANSLGVITSDFASES